MAGCRKNGEEIRLDIGLNSVLTAQGQFVLASIIDVTERWRAEEALRQLRAAAKPFHEVLSGATLDIAPEAPP